MREEKTEKQVETKGSGNRQKRSGLGGDAASTPPAHECVWMIVYVHLNVPDSVFTPSLFAAAVLKLGRVPGPLGLFGATITRQL